MSIQSRGLRAAENVAYATAAVVAVAAIVAALWAWGVGTAQAQSSEPTPLATCPADPSEYEGDDVVVAELRKLRSDGAAACRAQIAAVDALTEAADTEPVRARIGQLEDTLTSTATPTSVIVENDTGQTVPVREQHPVEPAAGDVDLDPMLATLDGNAEVAHRDAWFLVGLLVAAAGGVAFWRMVRP